MKASVQPGRTQAVAPIQLGAAYSICRHIARSSARNFYYGFLVLPRRKRDAICAVYAFMRHADDISDDPALTVAEKRERLAAWLEAMHGVIAGQPSDDAVLVALADASKRFGIAVDLLNKLVEGTAMDAASPATDPTNTTGGVEALGQASGTPRVLYRSFDELYGYCYHVASVVGLVVIRIFGYRDAAAELLAERTGIAFQLTNIIRDIKEDASFGRIYLPKEDLERFGVGPAAFQNGAASAALRPLLAMQAERAREYYRSAAELLPLISDDSQPALWTMVEIYRRLLEKIASRNFEVFGEKVRLSTAEKLSVLSKGLWLRLAT
jgi:phytoene synthase